MRRPELLGLRFEVDGFESFMDLLVGQPDLPLVPRSTRLDALIERNGRCTLSPAMVIAERLRELRESKKLSQGEIEKRTGLLQCYTSRVENEHTVPSIETFGKVRSGRSKFLHVVTFLVTFWS